VRTADRDDFPLAATRMPRVDGMDTTISYAEYATLHSNKILLQKKSEECWLMSYHVGMLLLRRPRHACGMSLPVSLEL
jgi:hypothetical protein